MPSARILASSLYGAARDIVMGNPLGALRQAVGGASAIAGGFGGDGGAAGAAGAAGDAEAVGLGLGPTLGIGVGATALAVGGYEAIRHPDIAKAVSGAPAAFYDAWHYSRDEAVRQTQAYGYAREFGEGGGALSAYTRSGKFSALGMDPQQALDVTGSMREIAGSQNVTDAQAYRATKLGTDIGLSNQDITAIGGAAGKLGVDPSTAIDIVAKGVERGGQKGLQGEVGKALLDYLRQQSQLGAVDETKAAETVTGVAALLGASGIAAFKGAGAVTNGVAGVAAANQPGDLFGVQSVGTAYTTIGQTRLLQAINRDPRFKRMSTLDKVGMADRILTQNFTGPNADMYLKSVIAPEIEQAKSQGLFGLESLEKQYGYPVGDATDKLLTGSLLTAAESGDVSAYLKLKSQLESNGPKNIPAATKAMAGHAAARAGTGASAMKTFTGIENLEASLVRKMAVSRETDSLVGLGMTKVAGALDAAKAPGGFAEATGWGAAISGGLGALADTFASARPPSPPTAAGGGDARDSTLNNVGDRIVAALNVLIQAVANGGSYTLPPAGFGTSPTAPALPSSPSRPDKKHYSPK